jgi:hypothetical protein
MEIRKRRGLDLAANFFDRLAGAFFDGNVFVGAEEILDGVIGVAVGGDEVDGGMFFCGVCEEIVDPVGGRGGRAADAQARVNGFESAGGVVVKIEIGGLLGIAGPEVDVGLIPDFEIPAGDFVDAVAIDEEPGETADENVPLRVVLGRGDVLLVPERVKVLASGKFPGHETDFDKGADAIGKKAVVDLADVSEIEEGIAGFVLVVDAEFIVENGVEADVAEIGDLFHFVKVVAVGFAKGKDGAAGAEGLFPEMGKGSGFSVEIDDEGLRRFGAGCGSKSKKES